MCGIAGIVSFGERNVVKINEEKIKKMNDTMIHRGPDDEGVYVNDSGRVGLGHRRLSIIDLSSAGHQPMSNEDDTIWLVFNGEIYNYLDIKKDLEVKGHKFKSKTDSETIIHLYEEEGVDCLKRLRGMFSLAIWDSKKQQLFIARDRIGIKPFYYYHNNGAFYFASEIKAIIENQEIKRELNKQGLYDYLTYMSVPAPNTMFKDIYKLPAGHYGTFTEKDGLNIERYWDLEIKADYDKSEKEWIEIIRNNIKEAIKQRMVCDVPFGAFLSGGIDSSLITVLMQEARGQPVDTFTVGFKQNKEFNELEHARKIRDIYHTKYHEILIDEDDLVKLLDKVAYYQDEPIADWVCFPLNYVSKLVRDSGVIVAQVGEGSDELFCGYPWFLHYLQLEKINKFLKLIPKSIKKPILNIFVKLPKINKKLILVEILRRMANEEFVFWGGANVYGEEEKHKLLKNYNFKNSYRIIKKILRDLKKHSANTDFLQKMSYLEFKQRLPELLLMRVDKMTMATSIESRVPFLDHIFVEKMMEIPTEVKTMNNVPKYILKKAAEGIIPDEIIYRKKQGFGAPISKWMKDNKIFNKFREIIYDENIKNLDLFDYDFIDYIFDSHKKGKVDYSVRIWLLVNFALWHKTFILQK